LPLPSGVLDRSRFREGLMMTDRKHPGRPAGLGLAGARLWRRVAAEFEMNPAELMLLEQACRTADVLTGIDEALDGEPLTVKGSMGQFASIR
jgi:hypothetical protein